MAGGVLKTGHYLAMGGGTGGCRCQKERPEKARDESEGPPCLQSAQAHMILKGDATRKVGGAQKASDAVWRDAYVITEARRKVLLWSQRVT